MDPHAARNVESLDILGDLESAPRRPTGVPCRIAKMRRDRPDLIPQWDRVIDAKKRGATSATHEEIATWFVSHGFPLSRNVPERHVKQSCTWCDSALAA